MVWFCNVWRFPNCTFNLSVKVLPSCELEQAVDQTQGWPTLHGNSSSLVAGDQSTEGLPAESKLSFYWKRSSVMISSALPLPVFIKIVRCFVNLVRYHLTCWQPLRYGVLRISSVLEWRILSSNVYITWCWYFDDYDYLIFDAREESDSCVLICSTFQEIYTSLA